MMPEQYLRSLRFLHLALVAGCALFMAVALAMGPEDGGEGGREDMFGILGLASLGMLPASFLLFRVRLRKAAQVLAMSEGMDALRSALVMHWALIEMPCMLNLVLLLLTGSMLHVTLALACLMMLILRAPTASRCEQWISGMG